jgi:hypothetical protein
MKAPDLAIHAMLKLRSAAMTRRQGSGRPVTFSAALGRCS